MNSDNMAQTESGGIIAAINAAAPPRQKNPWCVEGCPGVFYSEDGATRCECYHRHKRLETWLQFGGPARLFEASVPDAFNEPTKDVRLMRQYTIALCEFKDMPLGAKRTIRSLVIMGGDRAVKTAWAARTMQSLLRGGIPARWYDFAALRTVLSDYSRSDEQKKIVEQMRDTHFVVLSNVQGGQFSPAFTAAWDTLISERHNTGLPTLMLCEANAEQIKSIAWEDFLTDPKTLKADFDKFAPSANWANHAPSKLTRAAPKPSSPVERLTENGAIEDAIIMLVGDKGSPIWTIIRDGINADEKAVGSALRSLLKSGDVIEEKKQGRGGKEMTVFVLKPEDEEPTAPPVAKSGIRSLAELASITGAGKSSCGRWRSSGMTDEKIIAKCAGKE